MRDLKEELNRIFFKKTLYFPTMNKNYARDKQFLISFLREERLSITETSRKISIPNICSDIFTEKIYKYRIFE